MKFALALILTLTCTAFAALPAMAQATAPTLHAGKKWRIGYLEGGPYADYQATLTATVNTLSELGWIEPVDFPATEDPNNTQEIWKYLSENVQSEYIEFPADAFYSSQWEAAQRPKIVQQLVNRLKSKDDLDLIIAMGTWAGQDMAKADIKTPVEVCSASDPLKAEIIASEEDSGRPNLHTLVDATRFQRQIELFHDIIGFQTLGITYEDTVEGRSYAAVSDVEAVAKERGFKIVRCLTKNNVPDLAEANQSVVQCHKELAGKVDAVYITVQRGVNAENMPGLLAPLTEAGIPTFSQAGSKEVKLGVLLSISKAGMIHSGRFHAQAIAAMFNGASPGSLTMRFEHPPTIAINLAEAEAIGFDPPMDLLTAADEIYDDIEK